MNIRCPANDVVVVPGGQPMNIIVAVCQWQWEGPAIVVSSPWSTTFPARDQP